MENNEPTNKKPEEFACAVAVEEPVPEIRIERNDEQVLQIESDDESTRSDSLYGAEYNANRDSDAQSVLLEGDSDDDSARSFAVRRFFFTTSESSSDSRSLFPTDYGSEIMSLNDPFSSDSEMDFDDSVVYDDDGNPIDINECYAALNSPSRDAELERRYNELTRAPSDLELKVMECIKQYQIELLNLRIQQTATKVASVLEICRALMLDRNRLAEQQQQQQQQRRTDAPDPLDPDSKPDPIVE